MEGGKIDSNVKRLLLMRRGKLRKYLEARSIFPSQHPAFDGSYITIKCKSKYYNESCQWFINHPIDDKDEKYMEEYAYINHALICPFPNECPTTQKILTRYQKKTT